MFISVCVCVCVFVHVERMENERMLKRVMNARVNGRGARGRPRLGWMDGVKRVLREKGMDLREARERARDRNDWRVGGKGKGGRKNYAVGGEYIG